MCLIMDIAVGALQVESWFSELELPPDWDAGVSGLDDSVVH